MFIPFRLVAITFWLFDTLYFYKNLRMSKELKYVFLFIHVK